jgi:hypothetical protein
LIHNTYPAIPHPAIYRNRQVAHPGAVGRIGPR